MGYANNEYEKTQVFNAYKEAYKCRYGEHPLKPFPADFETFGLVLLRIGSLQTAIKLVRHFLTMNGYKDYFRDNGHTLSLFNANTDKIYADFQARSAKVIKRDYYVVGYSKCGTPVLSTVPNPLHTGFIPVPLDAWNVQTAEERLQRLQWNADEAFVFRECWKSLTPKSFSACP